MFIKIFVKKEKIVINLIKCFGYWILIGGFVVQNSKLILRRIFNHKIEFAINNLIMTVRQLLVESLVIVQYTHL